MSSRIPPASDACAHISGVSFDGVLLRWLQRMERIVQDWGEHVSVEPPGGDIGKGWASPHMETSRSATSEVCAESDSTEARRPPDLVIVVGKGSRSFGSAVLKQLVEEMLQDRGLPCTTDPQNEGRLIVAGTKLAAYVEQQRREQDRSSYWQIARWQYAAVGAGLSALLSMYIVPLTLKHAS